MKKLIRSIRHLLAAGILLAAAPAMAAATDDPGLSAFVDTVMQAQMKAHDLPTAVIAIVRDGRVMLARGYGYADRGKARRVDPATSLFRIGSTSKLFTWTAVMQLVEQGKLDLDRDVNAYLRGVHIPPAFGRPVTLRALLTHSAGFEDGGIGYLSHFTPPADASIERTLAAHIPARVRPPFALPAYSNFGAALAGLIVEQASGMPFDDYVATHILTPLGMRHATFAEPLPVRLAPDRVIAYDGPGENAQPVPFEFIAGFRPAGSMSASALDMARFMIAHLQHGRFGNGRILRPDTADLMHRTAFRTDPRLPGMALGFYEAQVGGLRMIGHGGATANFRSTMMLVPEARLGIFVAYVGTSSAAHRAIVKAIVSRWHPVPTPQSAVASTAGTAPYIGSYQTTRRNFTKFDKLLSIDSQVDVSTDANGMLVVSGLGEADEHYLPLGHGLFRQRDGDRLIAFSRLRDGHAQIMATDTSPYAPAERVTWYENVGTWWWILLSALAALCAAPVLFLRRPAGPASAAETWAVRSAVAVAIGAIAATLGIGFAIVANVQALEQPVAFSLRLSLLLPILVLLAAASLAWFTVVAWRAGGICLRRRIALAIILVAGIAVCLFFNHWNLIGWRFG